MCKNFMILTRRKLRQIPVGLIAGAVLIVLLLVIGGTTLILRSHSRRTREDVSAYVEEQISSDWLVKKLPAQQLKTTRINLAPYKRK